MPIEITYAEERHTGVEIINAHRLLLVYPDGTASVSGSSVEVVSEDHATITVKIPGGSVWNGRGAKRKYVPAYLEVYFKHSVSEPDERGMREIMGAHVTTIRKAK